MADPSIADDDLRRVTRVALERLETQPPPRDIEGEVMRLILAPHRARWFPTARLLVSGLAVAAVVAVGCVALALHLDRSSGPSTSGPAPQWTVIPGPNASETPYGALVDVSCPTAGQCWAVGDLEKGRNDVPLLERYADGGWTIVASPIPQGAISSGLASVTCIGADDCWAAGSYTDAGGRIQTLIEHDTGDGWSIIPSPTPPGGGALGSLACASTGACWAVGNSTGINGEPLIEEDTGSGWTIVPSPIPQGAISSGLAGVTCMGADDCWAVGTVEDIYSETTLVEHNTGSGWTMVTSPNPTGAASNTLNQEGGALDSVTCVNADDCWAVGSPTGPTGGARALIEQDSGSGWRIVSSPLPAGGRAASGVLNGITCMSAQDCWAVGFYPDAAGRKSLVEHYGGTGWHVVSSADAPGAFSTLYGVTCADAGDCWAVGLTGSQGLASPKDTLKNGTLIERYHPAQG